MHRLYIIKYVYYFILGYLISLRMAACICIVRCVSLNHHSFAPQYFIYFALKLCTKIFTAVKGISKLLWFGFSPSVRGIYLSNRQLMGLLIQKIDYWLSLQSHTILCSSRPLCWQIPSSIALFAFWGIAWISKRWTSL